MNEELVKRLKESTEILRKVRDLTEKRYGLNDEVKALDAQVEQNQKTMDELGIDPFELNV